MKTDDPTRPYRMTARARAAEATAHRILAAAAALWREQASDAVTLDAVTLDDIAARAGVSVRTVLRRFGSKEGVFEAAIDADAAGIEAERGRAPVGDVGAALDVLLDHYERDGDAVHRTLALEDQLEAARAIVEQGRASHRAWCARVFAPYLPMPDQADYTVRLDAFVAATDLYVWRLLRRDLGRSRAATRAALRTLLDGLTGSSSESSPQPTV